MREERDRSALAARDLFREAVAKDPADREAAEAAVVGLGRLSAEQREVIELKIYAGLTFREIAECSTSPWPPRPRDTVLASLA